MSAPKENYWGYDTTDQAYLFSVPYSLGMVFAIVVFRYVPKKK
jgi:hypothetical protein